MKRYFITLIILVCTVMQSHAVLKEKDLSRTIGCLKLELRNNHIKQRDFMDRLDNIMFAKQLLRESMMKML